MNRNWIRYKEVEAEDKELMGRGRSLEAEGEA